MSARPAAHTPFSRQIRDRLGDKWTVPIVDALSGGPLRFGELWRQVGAAPKVLTSVLRSLERDGLVERSESRDAGLHVEYTLSTTGRAFHGLVDDIHLWARRHEPHITAARQMYAPPSNRSAPAHMLDAAAGATATLGHICIPVRNIDQAARAFAEVLGTQPSGVCESKTVLRAGGAKERILIGWIGLPNLLIELVQQVSGVGPYNDFLDRTGPGIAHIGIDVPHGWRATGPLQPFLGSKLEERDDRRIYIADVDLNDEIGTGVQLMTPPLRATAERWLPSATAARTGLAARAVSRIGIVVPNAMRADGAYSTLLQILDPRPSPRARAFRYRQNDDAMIATCSKGSIEIDLIEPLRPGPLLDHLKQYGPSVHHIGFNVGSRIAESVRGLERRGAEPIAGDAKNGQVLLEVSRNLGLRVELTNASIGAKQAQV